VLRARLTEEVAAIGAPAMHERLAEVDPASAARLEPTDAQRVSRALEVWLSTGRRWSDWLAEPARPALDAAWRVIEVRLAGAPLAEWVTRRTHEWFEAGLVEETASLVHAGHGDALRALRAIGYDEAWALLEGTLDRASAEARTTLRTLQLAKRQRTWFRHQIDAVRLDAANPEIAEHALAAARG
jgi:tRNA dimethylallyltransferase